MPRASATINDVANYKFEKKRSQGSIKLGRSTSIDGK